MAFALTVPLFVGALAAGGAFLEAQTPAPPASSGRAGLADLERTFRTPPDDARIMMRWWWFGPTITRAGLERELRLMKDGGIGGVEIQPVYPVVLDDPASGLVTHPFLSDAFLDHLRFAAAKARELGLRVDLTIGSGWPYGGPQVGVTRAAGKLRIERVTVAAGAVQAPVPDIRTGERLIAAFLAPSAPATTTDGLREVSTIVEGRLVLPDRVPRPREVLFFISSRTGQMVKRAAVGSEGFVLNHYDRVAVDHYVREVGDRLLAPFGDTPPYAVFCDSLEVYESDWTDDFLEAFRAKRGYDLRPLLPALLLDAGPQTAAIRHDWGQTLTELVNERFYAPMQAWARARGTKFRIQGYGIPPATISSNADVDLPEGEGAQWRALRASRWASSIGHLYGRPVISSETWTWLHSPVFLASPLDLKAEADVHFLQGINQLIGHGWPYTADGVAYPGWRFYAAGVYNEKNPWWIVMPDVARYLQRMSWMLRQGQPVNDVAFYLPTDDAWAQFVPGKVGSFIDMMARALGPAIVPAVLDAGLNLDFVDDGVLGGRAKIEQGRLVIGGNRYRAVVLPNVERMPVATLRLLEDFAKQGGHVFATRRTPGLAPGYRASAADHAEVTAAADRLFRGPSSSGVFVERDADLTAILRSRVTPDVGLSAGVGAVAALHRRTDAADIYFVVNTSNTRQAVEATFRVAAGRAEAWNALTGSASPVAVRPAAPRGGGGAAGAGPEGATVALDLAPYESTVIVFPAGPSGLRMRQPRAAEPPRPLPPPLDISSGWRVAFGASGTPVEWPALRSWTDDEATKHFSGVATYEKAVDVPAALLRPGLTVRLDLGEPKAVSVGQPRNGTQAWLDAPVRDAAVVFVNGQRAGSVWCPPYVVDATALLKPGANTIRIEVANLALNHMAGRALPDYKLLNLRYGARFDPQDMDKVQAVPAGLVGPIRLVAVPAQPGAAAAR
jgi:hypothetical protein